jgi:DinB superfamily
MTTPSSQEMPRLAPPGAGLPWLELRIARLGFDWLQRRTGRAEAAALLARERETILKLVDCCDAEAGSRRVLIDRLRGMEDSSRFWSVFMTLDHLRIVNLAVSEVIRLLGVGQVPAGEARTADVKPDAGVDHQVIGDFERSCERVVHCAAAVPNLKTPRRFAHPWFGTLDGAGWHFLAGVHLQLHRRQIEQILRHLTLDGH